MKEEYSKIEHAKLIGAAIERMGNNHTKWLFALFTIIGFGITMDKFLFEIDGWVYRTVALSISSLITIVLLIICFKMSWNYLDLETRFRNKQSKAFKGELKDWDMNPNKEKGIKRKSKEGKDACLFSFIRKISWIMKAAWLIITIYSLSSIGLSIFAAFV